jgi:DNA repair protein RecO (recombination protein O)
VPSVENTVAILLRKTKLTETSLILTWLSVSYGIVKTVAKGARQPKSRFAGVLDLFFLCEIEFTRSRQSELHMLREVALRDTHPGLRTDYQRLTLAAYFVELIELVTEPEHSSPELFDLMGRALAYLQREPASLRGLLHFERELTRLLGIQDPEVSAARALNRTYHRLPAARVPLIESLSSEAARLDAPDSEEEAGL